MPSAEWHVRVHCEHFEGRDDVSFMTAQNK